MIQFNGKGRDIYLHFYRIILLWIHFSLSWALGPINPVLHLISIVYKWLQLQYTCLDKMSVCCRNNLPAIARTHLQVSRLEQCEIFLSRKNMLLGLWIKTTFLWLWVEHCKHLAMHLQFTLIRIIFFIRVPTADDLVSIYSN